MQKTKHNSLILFLLERIANQIVKLGVLSYILAWLLTRSSRSVWINLPVAIFLVIALRWLALRVVVRTEDIDKYRKRPNQTRNNYIKIATSCYDTNGNNYENNKIKINNKRDNWKRIVNAPIVESAWESLCGSIIQEWIYDAWYSLITPDREFPSEVRSLLNQSFADITQRARRIDLRTVLIRDICDLFIEQLELYRVTKENVGILNEGDLRPLSRDRAFFQEMKTERKLHLAFRSRDGHYKVIKRISEGIVGIVMHKEDLSMSAARVLMREITATCVLRPIIMFFTPYNANKLFLSLFPKELEKMRKTMRELRDMHLSSQEKIDGYVKFQQRVRRSVALEERLHRKSTEISYEKLGKIQEGTNNKLTNSELAVSDTDVLLSCGERRDIGTGFENSSKEDEMTVNKVFDDLTEGIMAETDVLDRDGNSDGSDNISQLTEKPMSITSDNINCPPLSSIPRNIIETTDNDVLEPSEAPLPSCYGRLNIKNRHTSVVKNSFIGWPRARVVAPEINSNRGKEYVVFKIRVADDSGEWTVARRFRNFESLHKVLREDPEYFRLGLRLPPKGITLLYTHTTEFVEQRRVALDKYLQVLLSCEKLAHNKNVWLFLSDQNCKDYSPDMKVGFTSTVASNFDNARYKVKKSLKNALDQRREGFDQSLRNLDISEQSSVASSIRYQNEEFNQNQKTILKQVYKNDFNKEISYNDINPTSNNLNKQNQIFNSMKLTNKFVSMLDVGERYIVDDIYKDRLRHDSSLNDVKSMDSSSETPFAATNTTSSVKKNEENENQAMFNRNNYNNWNKEYIHNPSSNQQSSEDDEEIWPDWDAEFEDYAGISGPLYAVADAVFSFPTQKFFRRQVLQVLRQTLSLLAGDAIDVYLVEKIKYLRSEHTIAMFINFLKNTLWPNGVWFMTLDTNIANSSSTMISENSIKNVQPKGPKGVQKETYLKQVHHPKDEAEMADRLRHRLFRRAPAALVRILGRNCYTSGMKDVYEMLQLPTFVTQIGYGIVEIIVLSLYPELKELFMKMHKEAASM